MIELKKAVYNGEMPKEVEIFFYEMFDFVEKRVRVGQTKNLIFEIRSRETNHGTPHVHVRCAEHNISIKIETGEVLEGNFPPKKQKEAQTWVKEHRKELFGK